MYHRGTLSEFNIWHVSAKAFYGIPAQGLVGYVNSQPAPQNERTIAYSEAVQNPNKSDDYIWPYGAYPDGTKTILTQANINSLNWFVGV